ncbi:MAG: hypothetical protein PF447_05195 [Spirochaetaceae bacterium]|jgi:hypothetical protein|nr:hypothetical protein [Spirochaetaceae bacterium]
MESTVSTDEFNPSLSLDMLNASIQTYKYFGNKEVVPPQGWLWDGKSWNRVVFMNYMFTEAIQFNQDLSN